LLCSCSSLESKKPASDYHQVTQRSCSQEKNPEHGDVAFPCLHPRECVSPRGTTGEAATIPGTSSIAAFMSSIVSGFGSDIGNALGPPAPGIQPQSGWCRSTGSDSAHTACRSWADGYDQDQGGGADHHPQRGQRESAPCCCRKKESLGRRNLSTSPLHHLRRNVVSGAVGGGQVAHASSALDASPQNGFRGRNCLE